MISGKEALINSIDELWDALGSGVWLIPGNYEALRERYNELAEAAETTVLLYRLYGA